MEQDIEINSFLSLEKVLEQGTESTIQMDNIDLVKLYLVFKRLSDKLDLLYERFSKNDVLVTRSLGEGADVLVEESERRAHCVELFLKYEDLPQDIKEPFTKCLPDFKEFAVICKQSVTLKKQMLQTIQNATLKSKQQSSSGCMVTILIFIIFSCLFCFA